MKINWSLAAATHCRPGIIIVEPRVCLLVIFNKIFSSCWKIFLSDIKCSCSNNFLWESIGHYSIDINLHVQLNNSINWCTEAFSPHILSKRNISAESIKLYFVFFLCVTRAYDSWLVSDKLAKFNKESRSVFYTFHNQLYTLRSFKLSEWFLK